jgi:hypothetical protein
MKKKDERKREDRIFCAECACMWLCNVNATFACLGGFTLTSQALH